MKYLELDYRRPFDVVLLGRIAIDFNPVEYFKPWPECDTFKKYVGGSPANIAVGLARLGKQAGFLGCVSNDSMGDYCLGYFQKEGIDTSHIVRAQHGESMGLAFTEVPDKNHSRLMMYRNCAADLQLSVADIDEKYIKSAKILLVSGTALAASPSREAAMKAIELARRNGTAVVFDIDYREYTWKNKEETALYYTYAGRMADVIMGSREEYDLMDFLWRQKQTDQETADRWFQEKAKILIIKHGKEGSAAYLKNGEQYQVKPFPVEAMKGFGGGDGYGSSFLNGLLEEWDMASCLEYASASASMLVASHGCSADMPTLEEIREFIEREKTLYGEMITRKR